MFCNERLILLLIKQLIQVVSILLVCANAYSQHQVTVLEADGPNQGKSAYELITEFGGRKSIESPDLYSENHPQTAHIYEDTDPIMGHHFVFLLHRDIDRDRNKYIKFADRQRNEIKAYSGSRERLKGYEGQTLTYNWKFKLDPNMSLSKNFSHFFQLKSVDDGIGMPIVTISGISYKGKRWLGVSHAAVKKASILERKPWGTLSGVWLQAHAKATFSDQGNLTLRLTRLDNQETVIDIELTDLDMWRGTKKSHFVRPKWGLYRSLKSKHMLVNEQDSIRFADFEVIKHAQ